MGIESTTFWLLVQYGILQIITIVPHTDVKQIFNRYRFKAIHKNTITVCASTCNGVLGDLYQLKHTDI